MTLTPLLAWLCPSVPKAARGTGRLKAIVSFLSIWVVQVALAILLLPVLLLVLIVGGLGAFTVWLTGVRRGTSPGDEHSETA